LLNGVGPKPTAPGKGPEEGSHGRKKGLRQKKGNLKRGGTTSKKGKALGKSSTRSNMGAVKTASKKKEKLIKRISVFAG